MTSANDLKSMILQMLAQKGAQSALSAISIREIHLSLGAEPTPFIEALFSLKDSGRIGGVAEKIYLQD